ncbi:microtubule-associated protein 10 [Rhea pennata]|uniref:microtubule-associated protein 10 n=1 Tax=Rhea pennata TaxID=8795 RepID=UPI002E265FD0
MAAAEGGEGLFALELLVEAVRVEAPGPALRPAVALRLLDFPPLLVHAPAAAPPLQPGRPCAFGRGKRCLFRRRRGSLCAALRRRPLRALLLALPAAPGPGPGPGPPRLLGACGVSLAPAAAELLRRPAAATASWGRRGRFPLRDAAGRPVGELALGYRLSSLGAAAEPEPGPPRATSPGPAPGAEEEEEGEEEGEELEGNIFRPPVLYYSRGRAEPRPAAAAAPGPQQRGEARSPPRPGRSRSPGPGRSPLRPASPGRLRDAARQLPLLSALLAELSVLAQPGDAPAAVHPRLAWLYSPPGEVPTAGGGCSPGPDGAAAGPSEAASPESKRSQQEPASAGPLRARKGAEEAVPLAERGSGRKQETKANAARGRHLLYGLTNTLRLRLQQTNPGMLMVHERRERYRKKQVEMLKEKRSPLSKKKLVKNAGGQHLVSYRRCSRGDGSKQSNQFDETVETSLQSNALKEYSSTPGNASPDLQKQAVHSLLRNYETAQQECPCELTTAPLLQERVLKSAHREKGMKVQLLAPFRSDADAKESNDDASVVSDHKSKPSPSRSVESNSEFIYSDDFVASPENSVYSEGISSADYSGRGSQTFDSSPEPLWVGSLKQPHSHSESESSRSRVSKMSRRTESTSALVPVPSASSPVHSLKRNCDGKTSKRTSGEAVDLLNDASFQAGLLHAEETAHQISKEENRVDQHIEQAPTPRSKEISSDSDLNIGKGQTSVEKSQSLTQASSYLPSNMSDLEPSPLENSMSDRDDDFLGTLSIPHQYKDISELVISKLPGYTM